MEETEALDKGSNDSDGIRKWDLFKVVPPPTHVTPVEERTWYQLTVKFLKICVYCVTFVMVLGGAAFSKFGLLVMTPRLNGNAVVTHCGNSTPATNPLIPVQERIYWTWLIYFAFMVPEVFTLFRSLRFCIFKGQSIPSFLEFLFPFLFETLHTIGLGFFVFSVLPFLDSVKGAILFTTVCFIPAILAVFSGYHGGGWNVYRILNIVAVFIQGTTIFMWILFPESSEKNIWLLPIALILISFGFWHNYVDFDSKFRFVRYLAKFKPELLENGYFTYTFISIWKMLVFLGIMLLSVEIQGVQDVGNLFSMFTDAFGFSVNGTGTSNPSYAGLDKNQLNIWLNPLFIQVMASLLCYVFGKYACKICIQHLSFALPLTLAVPLTMAILATVNPCFFNNPFFGSLEFVTPTGNYFTANHAWIWPLWFLSQFWITIQIWLPNSDRLSRTENIFSIPMYSGLLVDQSLALNRRRDKKVSKIKKLDTDGNTIYINQSERDDIPRIYACATMWHETEDEMLEIMKSILRMDEDQGVRRIAAQQFQIVDNYYEYETHILFDDAFQLSDPDDYNSPQILNSFVKTFIGVVDAAAEHVHGMNIHIRPPNKFPTPYGGRLEWTLPGKTKMLLHLKDKSKIRHKKRWSQCMYMYYLLGHRLMDLPISEQKKEIRARNTFILALDGDVDFQPIAVERLIDLMKRNPKLGAACGRIHPTGGAGLMLWYQKFEYAIGHWLQKATEHMIGCVLCSPGCFSLFRGKALMSDNVMAKYTTVSTEPRHYVQYDQGEDRWLCTLIIQQGYRVDYCAASDALTHAPEDFDEFYNQRRRWVPSTTANIMDMLTDFRKTIAINPDISFWYIAYQFFLMFATIIGPGTIFLMLVGALNAVLGVSKWLSLGLNLVPVLAYSLVCYYGKSKTQLTMAKILSVAYALVMVAVLVGIAVTVSEEGFLSPSALFLVAITLSFVISALMHPLEISCLLHGFVYFITIPSMYLLLIIFSIFNINNVSWGTREGPKVKSKQELLEEEKEIEEQKKKQSKNGLFGFLREGKDDSEGSFEFSFAGLFKLMCCTHEKKDSSDRIASSLEHLSSRLETLDRKLDNLTSGGGKGEPAMAPPLSPAIKRISSFRNTKRVSSSPMEVVDEDEELKTLRHIHFEGFDESKDEELVRDDMVNPFWITDPILMRRKIDTLSKREILFWNELIEKYLLPIDANKKKEKEMADALLRLRNQCVFTFFMLNSILILLIFFLELEKKSVHIKWPFGNQELILEPIGFLFVIFFAIILVIQFIAMLFHRFGTLSHILASTPLNLACTTRCNTKNVAAVKKDASVSKGGLGLVHALMQGESFDETASEKRIKKKIQEEDNSVANLHRRTLHAMNACDSLDDRFDKNWSRLSQMPESAQERVLSRVAPIDKSQRRDTWNALRSRLSVMQPSADALRSRRSVRQSSAASETSSGSYTGSGSSESDSDSDAGNSKQPPLPQNPAPIPTIRIEGFENEGFLAEEQC